MRYVDAKVDTNVKTTIIDTSFFNIISLKMVAFVVVIVQFGNCVQKHNNNV
jgi:hypothetical protein